MNRQIRNIPAAVWLGLFAVSAASASTFVFTNSPCVYLLSSNSLSQTATLLGPTGVFSGSLSIPVYVKSSLFSVTSIAPGAFRNCGTLTSVSLDSSSKVGVVGAGAFWGCTNLISVTLRSSVTSICDSAFLDCSSLSGIDLSALTGLRAIAGQTFCRCAALASVVFCEGITNVGPSAFRDCKTLGLVSLPTGVVGIADSAFQGCRRMSSASFPGVIRLGVNAFSSSGLTSVSIPADLTNIVQGAFANCTNLVSVSYEGSPTSVGAAAFRNCSALTSLPISSAWNRIASTAFAGCSGVTSATLPSGVDDLSDNLFEGCAALRSVTVGGAVSSIGDSAFADCPCLTNVTSLGDVPDADGDAFDGSEQVFVYYYKGASGWKNLLAHRPTVMLGDDGSVVALSFGAWAVWNGITNTAALSDEALSELFAQASSSASDCANGIVYAFGENLTTNDEFSLLHITVENSTPIVETPALDSAVADYVSCAVEATTNLLSGTWDLTVDEVSLADATRTGYTPAAVDGALPPQVFFRLKLSLIQ